MRTLPIRCLALAIGVVPLVLMTASAGASPGAQVPLPVVSLNTIAPVNQAVEALLPKGPQHITVTFSESSKGVSPFWSKVVGYVNFTGGDQAGCSYDVLETASYEPKESVRSVRAAYKPSYSATISGSKKNTNYTKLNKYYQTGVSGKAPLLAVPFVPAGIPQYVGTQITAGTGSGWCLFDELDRYTTFVHGSSGPLRVNIAAVAALSKAESQYALVGLINGAHFTTEQDALAAYHTYSNLPAPDYAAIYKEMHWTLARHGSVVTLTNDFPEPAGDTDATTVVFTPTKAQVIPSVKGESLSEQLGTTPAKLRKYLTTLH